jgi:hypothetical protein
MFNITSKVKDKVHLNIKCHLKTAIRIIKVSHNLKNVQIVTKIMYRVRERKKERMRKSHRNKRVNRNRILSKLEIIKNLPVKRQEKL